MAHKVHVSGEHGELTDELEGVGDVRNMTDLDMDSSWLDTILTAVRSSMESPKEMISQELQEGGASSYMLGVD